MTQTLRESEFVMAGEAESKPVMAEMQSQFSPIVFIDLGLSGMDNWDGYRQGLDLINVKEL